MDLIRRSIHVKISMFHRVCKQGVSMIRISEPQFTSHLILIGIFTILFPVMAFKQIVIDSHFIPGIFFAALSLFMYVFVVRAFWGLRRFVYYDDKCIFTKNSLDQSIKFENIRSVKVHCGNPLIVDVIPLNSINGKRHIRFKVKTKWFGFKASDEFNNFLMLADKKLDND